MDDENGVEEDTLEVSDLEATSEPGNLDETVSETDGAKADGASLTETIQNSQQSSAELEQTSQTSSPSVQPSLQKSDPNVQTSAKAEDAADMQSLSQEGSKKSQLSYKRSSLDQLANGKSSEGQKSRSNRMQRQCQRSIRELIGKREMKNEELEKVQGDLRQRLNILECSMPAVMVWNIWRMSQGGSVPRLRRVLEKQFQGPASGEIYCPSTPSRHFDCRVREVEADRKQAQKRVEEARTLWAEKMTVLEEREKKLEEAKKIQAETKAKIQQLTAEVQKLKEAAANVAEDDGACETGECGIIECKKKWLGKISSNASIKSTDLECLEKLQELAETELCMKKQIADLERREEAYMRTLQQADELWLKIEGDTASTMSALQEQLDTKTAANQQMANRICQLEDQLEMMRSRMVKCRGELEKFMSIEKIEALIGRDDDFAEVFDKTSGADLEMRYELGLDDVGIKVEPYTDEKGIMMRAEMREQEMLAKPGVFHAMQGIHPDELAAEQEKLDQARDYLARLGSLSALDGDDERTCDPTFKCNDQVFTETGLTEEEMTALKEKRVTAKMLMEAMMPGYKEVRTIKPAKEPTVPKEEPYTEVVEPKEEPHREVEQPKEEPHTEVEQPKEEPHTEVEQPKEEPHMEVEQPKEEPHTEVEETTVVVKQELPSDEEEEIIGGIIESDEMKEPIVETEFVEEAIQAPSAFERPMEVTTSTIEGTPDTNDILIPRNEMLKWRDDIDIVRVTIAKNSECVVVKKNADDVAKGIARYIGTELKEVKEEYISHTEDVAVETEKVSVKEAEIQIKIEPEETAEPIEVEKPVIVEVVTQEYPPEPPIAPLVQAKPDTEVVPEVKHEPEEIYVPPVDVKEEAKPVKVEEETGKAEEILPGKIDTGPEQVIEVEVEALPVQREEPEVIEAALPARDDEVEMEVEVLQAVEEEREREEIPEKHEVEVKTELPPAEEEVVLSVRQLSVIQEVTLEEEVDLDVEILPVLEEELPDVEEAGVVETVPEEEIEDEVDMIPDEEITMKEAGPEEEIEIEVDMVPDEEITMEEASPEEEIEIEVDMVPDEEITMEEAGPEKEIEIEVDMVPEVDEVTVVEAPSEEEVEVKVDVVPEEEVEVEVDVVPEEEVEVEVDVVPEEEEEIPMPEEEIEVDVALLPIEEEVAVTEEEVGEEIPSKLTEEPEMLPEEVPVMPSVKPGDFFLVPSEEDVAACVCTTDDTSKEDIPSQDTVSSEEASCICTSDVPSEGQVPSEGHVPSKGHVPSEEASCTCTSDVPSEGDVPAKESVPTEKDDPCPCITHALSGPSKKMEDTQTEITQMSITQITTAEVVTQTMTEVAIQTQPAQKIKRGPPPKYITISGTCQQEAEMMDRLTRWKKVSKERSTITTTTIASQTEKFNYSQALHTSKTEVLSKIGVEHELRSIHYGTKVEQPADGQCNCCLCGKTVSTCCLNTSAIQGQPQSILRLLAALSKLKSSPVDQDVQQETFCPECKMKRFEEAVKIPDSSEKPEQVVRKPMCDQEIDASSTSSRYKKPSSTTGRQKTDQSCMVKISRLRMERTLKKNTTVDKLDKLKTCTLCTEDTKSTVGKVSPVDTVSGECQCLKYECLQKVRPQKEHLSQKSCPQGCVECQGCQDQVRPQKEHPSQKSCPQGCVECKGCQDQVRPQKEHPSQKSCPQGCVECKGCQDQVRPQKEHLSQKPCPKECPGCPGCQETPKEEDEEDCMCNTTESDEQGVLKTVRCACGDPD